MGNKIYYCNTDLDLVSPTVPTALVAALESKGVCPLGESQKSGDGKWYTTFETASWCADPDSTMSEILDAISALRGNAKKLWSKCSLREFNIGYQCGDEPWAFNNGLTNNTLKRIGAVGASLRITLYPPEKQAVKKRSAKSPKK